MITTATIDRLGKRLLLDLRWAPGQQDTVANLAATERTTAEAIWCALGELRRQQMVERVSLCAYRLSDRGRLVAL